jgi:hypothetical protein
MTAPRVRGLKLSRLWEHGPREPLLPLFIQWVSLRRPTRNIGRACAQVSGTAALRVRVGQAHQGLSGRPLLVQGVKRQESDPVLSLSTSLPWR